MQTQFKTDQLIAVYGTLRKGHGNGEALLGDAEYLGRRRLSGYMMYFGLHTSYPYVWKAASQLCSVIVEVFRVKPEKIRELDRLEGVPHHYTRIVVRVGDNRKAWMYVKSPDEGPMTVYPGGDFNEFERAKAEWTKILKPKPVEQQFIMSYKPTRKKRAKTEFELIDGETGEVLMEWKGNRITSRVSDEYLIPGCE